jgi:hypothetical protein
MEYTCASESGVRNQESGDRWLYSRELRTPISEIATINAFPKVASKIIQEL